MFPNFITSEEENDAQFHIYIWLGVEPMHGCQTGVLPCLHRCSDLQHKHSLHPNVEESDRGTFRKVSHIVHRFPGSEQACGHLKPPSDCPSSASLIKRKGQQPRSNLPPCHLVDGRAFCCLCWYIGYCTENLGSTRNSQPECEWNLLSFSFSPLTIQGLPNTIRVGWDVPLEYMKSYYGT